MSTFDLIDQPFLTGDCAWQNLPAGLEQTTNGTCVLYSFFKMKSTIIVF